MIVLALDENLDPALVSDLLQEAGFKVVKGPLKLHMLCSTNRR